MKTYIPYGCYWSTPFARWQGSLAEQHALTFAAGVARDVLERKKIAPDGFDGGILGTTVPQPHSFYGLPWVASMAGLEHLAGPTVNQACATSARCLAMADQDVRLGEKQQILVITADRTSNGPHLYYPQPKGPGGTGQAENWVLDNFSLDPWATCAMVDTAENVAREFGLSTELQHELVLHRNEQYQAALADDGAFQRRYMPLPLDVKDARGRVTASLTTDEGIYPTKAEKLAGLKPVQPGGTVTFAAQTHPADGNAGMVVTNRDRARELSLDPAIEIELLGFGEVRERKGFMPAAPIAASRKALEAAGLDIAQMDAIKSHNPFAVNDLAFASAFGIDWQTMNNYGCSLVWGHPQGPTGLRAIIELIEELALRGGGTGLFQGCAAGDTGMALVLRVGEGRSA